MEACQINILNWKRYQAEGIKYESTGWYRQENSVWQHAIFQFLTGDEYKAKVFIDCQVSQRGHKTGIITLDLLIASKFIHVEQSVIISALEKLASPRLRYLEFQEIPLEQLDHPEPAPGVPRVDTEYAPSIQGATYETERNETERNETDMSAEADPPAPPVDLLAIWNSECGTICRAEKLTEKRSRAMKARIREHPDPEYWTSVAKRIAASPFCRGERGGWKASFDWFITPDAHVKVLEGKYDGSKIVDFKTNAARSREEHAQSQWERVEKGLL